MFLIWAGDSQYQYQASGAPVSKPAEELKAFDINHVIQLVSHVITDQTEIFPSKYKILIR